MKSEVFETLLAELNEELADVETREAVLDGKYGWRLFLRNGEFWLEGHEYFARENRDGAMERAFHSGGAFQANLNLWDPKDARTCLEIAAHEVEVEAYDAQK
jgi:hypothetical protein